MVQGAANELVKNKFALDDFKDIVSGWFINIFK